MFHTQYTTIFVSLRVVLCRNTSTMPLCTFLPVCLPSRFCTSYSCVIAPLGTAQSRKASLLCFFTHIRLHYIYPLYVECEPSWTFCFSDTFISFTSLRVSTLLHAHTSDMLPCTTSAPKLYIELIPSYAFCPFAMFHREVMTHV
jgi:hypothetical protein